MLQFFQFLDSSFQVVLLIQWEDAKVIYVWANRAQQELNVYVTNRIVSVVDDEYTYLFLLVLISPIVQLAIFPVFLTHISYHLFCQDFLNKRMTIVITILHVTDQVRPSEFLCTSNRRA